MKLEPSFLALAGCPRCRTPLRETTRDGGSGEQTVECTSADCALVFPVRDGIPVLLVDEARRTA